MKAIQLFIILIYLLCLPEKALGQLLQGQVVDKDTGDSLSFVQVYNFTSKKSVVTHETGSFTLEAQPGDTVVFLFMGYQDRSMVLREHHFWSKIIVTLSSGAIILPGVKVMANRLPLLQNNERKIMEVPGLPIIENPQPIEPMSGKWGNDNQNDNTMMRVLGLHYTIQGPFSYFGRKEKEKRKLKRVLKMPSYTVLSAEFKQEMKSAFQLNEEELDWLIIQFNKNNPDMLTTISVKELQGLFLAYVSSHSENK